MRFAALSTLLGLSSLAQADPGAGEPLGRRAEARAWRIELPAGAACPADDALQDEVERELGHTAADPLEVALEVRRETDGFRGQLVLGGGGEVRELVGASCAEVVSGAALIIALAIEAMLRPARRTPVAAAASRPAAPVAALAAGEPERGRVMVELEVGGEVGPMPEPSAVAAAALGIGAGAWSAALTAEGFRGAEVAAAGGLVTLGLWDAGLRGCGASGWLETCVGGVVGQMSGRGRGLAAAQEGSALVVGVDFAVRARVDVWRQVGLFAEVGTGLWSNRPSFALRDGARVYQAELFRLFLRVGASFAIP